jgi:hypothetical protein
MAHNYTREKAPHLPTAKPLCNMKHTLTILIIILICSTVNGQSERIKLDFKIFESKIKNQAWSLEDSNKKDSSEMFVMNFLNDTISLAYVDWMEGLTGIYGKYSAKFQNNFVELKPKKWFSSIGPIDNYKRPKPFYIYCYLKNDSTLLVLFAKQKIEMGEKLIVSGDWYELELIKD